MSEFTKAYIAGRIAHCQKQIDESKANKVRYHKLGCKELVALEDGFIAGYETEIGTLKHILRCEECESRFGQTN